MMIDDPQTLAEVRAAFEGYEAALMANDVTAFDQYFWQAPLAVRFGVGESLFGHEAIAAFRAARVPVVRRSASFGRRRSPVLAATMPWR